MPSIVVIKSKLENPMEWFSKNMQYDSNWSFDEQLNENHMGQIYMKQSNHTTSFEDLSEEAFFGLKIRHGLHLLTTKN